MVGHSGHSKTPQTSLYKKIIKEKEKVNAQLLNKKEKSVSTMSKTDDKRLSSVRFKKAVRLVMADLKIENKMSNFRRLDSLINWIEYADNLENPIWTAIVEIKGTIHTLGLDLRGKTRAQAKAKINTKKYKFVKWF